MLSVLADQTGVKSALEVIGERLPGPVASSPHGAVGNDPGERSNTLPASSSPPFLHTHTKHNTHTNSPEPGRAQESVAWGRLEGKPGMEYVILGNVGWPSWQPVDSPPTHPPTHPPTLHLQNPPNTHTHIHILSHTHQSPAEAPPTWPRLSHCSSVIHRVPKPAALLKPRKSKAWPRFKQQCSWDLLHFRQTALSVSLAINSLGGCLP